MNVISMIVTILGFATAALNMVRAAIEFLPIARKGRSRKEDREQ